MKVLFVCLGNICRSVTAQAVLEKLAAQMSVAIEVDSAGTANYHVGKSPDSRSQKAALKRGVDISAYAARQVTEDDFHNFDYIFAMDKENLKNLQALQPKAGSASLALFLEGFGSLGVNQVPDPYYGDGDGFETVLNLLEDACQTFLQREGV